jgi:hypothetical protein
LNEKSGKWNETGPEVAGGEELLALNRRMSPPSVEAHSVSDEDRLEGGKGDYLGDK